MGKGAGDSPNDPKNSIDNPENARDNEGNQDHVHVKKDVQNQIQESNTQMSFKVNLSCWVFMVFYDDFYVHTSRHFT